MKKKKKREERERETRSEKKKLSRKNFISLFLSFLSSQHNKASVGKAVDLLSRLEKERPGDAAAASSRVSFGQLYGMR